MYRIQESITINAPKEKVFAKITNFAEYENWNTWIKAAEGTAEKDGIVWVNVLLNGKMMRVKHKILELEAPYKFTWCDMGWFTLFAFGKRERQLESLDNEQTTNYKVTLTVTGIASPIVKLIFDKALRKGMKAETLALQKEFE